MNPFLGYELFLGIKKRSRAPELYVVTIKEATAVHKFRERKIQQDVIELQSRVARLLFDLVRGGNGGISDRCCV